MKTIPKFIPFGRIGELREHPDAKLIAVKPGRGLFTDYQVKRYNSLPHFSNAHETTTFE